MTVEIRQAGAEWLVEVHGEPVGRADSAVEALELASYWERRLDCVASWRVNQDKRPLPDSLTRILGATQVWGRAIKSLEAEQRPNAEDSRALAGQGRFIRKAIFEKPRTISK